MSKATPVLELKSVSKIYTLGDQTLYATRNLSLAINEGDFAAIVGPSGSGKSTFLHIASLLDKPTDGTVLMKGKDVTTYTETERARLRNKEIGFIFQQFNLLARTSAVDNVSLPLLYSGVSKAAREKKAIEMLERVGLGDRLLNTPAQLSGGQQQRVAIARALVNDPAIIFADEPTGNLDSKTGDEIEELLAELNEEGRTLVMVTHDDTLARDAKRKITLRDGQVVEDVRQN